MNMLRRPLRSFWMVLFVLSLVLFGITPTSANAPTLHLMAPDGPQSAIAPLDVQVQITGAANLGAWEFDLQYDPALVTITGISVNDFFARSVNCDPVTARCAVLLGPIAENGIFSAGAVSYGAAAGSNGDGVIATLHLQPTGVAGITQLQFASALLTDPAANPITPATVGAMLEFAPPAFSAPNVVFLPLVDR